MSNRMISKEKDVVALGELLIDFTESAPDDRGMSQFCANPGGAPCNVLAMLHNLGYKAAFIGKVGNDMFGQMLERMAAAAGIDMSGLVKSDCYQTTLAFVQTKDNGDRDFAFYRKNGADAMLEEKEVDASLIEAAKVFHFGTLSMTDEVGEQATKAAIATAKKSGCLISFDPNYREPLWRSQAYAKEKIAWGLHACDVLKISDNEITLMTGETDYRKGAKMLQEEYRIPIVFATLGADGSMAFWDDNEVFVPGFINPATIETTGAGDTFCACALGKLLELAGDGDSWDKSAIFDKINEETMTALLTYANAAASMITTRKGALCVMPQKQEIEEFLGSYS